MNSMLGTSQHASHDQLLRDRSGEPVSAGRPGRLDAIVVPASRPAHQLRAAVRLGAQTGTLLVVIASGGCRLDDLAALVAAEPGARAVLVQAPTGDEVHPALQLQTSSEQFRTLASGRTSDLSLKRNLGLLLARLRGWRKVLFLDDDIRRFSPDQLRRVATQLETHRIAGLRPVHFPDNSVVCHARRMVGETQGIFVSGAALGVNCSDLPLDVFVDMYNEDWFAMYKEASGGGVTSVGTVQQLSYDPFTDPERAAREEFGDVLAEGLFTMLHQGDGPARATRAFWAEFIDGRERLIIDLQRQLLGRETHETVQAALALQRSLDQLHLVSPGECLDFIEAWEHDKATFERLATRMHPVANLAVAMDQLGVRTWQEAEFATPVVERRYAPVP